MTRELYWIWLSQGLGTASPAAQAVVEHQLDPQKLCAMSLQELLQMELFSAEVCKKLKSFPLQSAQKILDRCNERGYSVLSIEDQDYPRQLLSLCDPPLVLYVQGDTRLLGMMETLPVLAVVGTRNPSDYGVRAAKDLSRKLAQMGLVIVSGLAMGIDACAHQSTLSVHGKTVTVLGCGLDYIYPAQTAGLREQILRQGGTVLSELAPAVSVNGKYFPVRNRLIAGLSQGVLVVEAPARSGALITASCALEQGKDVFAVPFGIYDRNGAGTLGLIRDGAIPAISAQDVAYPFAQRLSRQIALEAQKETAQVQKIEEKTIQEKEKTVHDVHPFQREDEHAAHTLPKTERIYRGSDEKQINPDVESAEWKREKEKLLTEFLTLTNQHKEEIAPEEILKSLPIQNRTSQVPANSRPLTIDQAEQPEENSLTESMTEQQKKVYGMLTKKPQPLEELAQRCQMSVGELTSILFEIGVPDPIRVYPGRMFSLK